MSGKVKGDKIIIHNGLSRCGNIVTSVWVIIFVIHENVLIILR